MRTYCENVSIISHVFFKPGQYRDLSGQLHSPADSRSACVIGARLEHLAIIHFNGNYSDKYTRATW